MAVPVTVFDTPDQLGQELARQIADGIAAAAAADERFVLGCPGGRTPRATYRALAAEVAERRLGLSHVVIAMMDEYVLTGPDGSHRPADPEAHYSCRRFGQREIREPLNAAAPGGGGIPADQVWLPEPAEPSEYDARLRAAGGIDLFLLASGESDGHVAFNPPGSPRTSQTRVVALPESTRQDNLGTFDGFASVDEVPPYGVTVGISTIADLSRRLVLIVEGAHKRPAFTRVSTAVRYDPRWPATVVAEGKSSCIMADAAAAVGEPQ